uniref:hypothetical protein n=1 Tax=Agrobacterium fabrum TaxID=1176649 RepID=UPI0021BD8D1E|nr:hypothetical protein [Agrobacterium fabrum]
MLVLDVEISIAGEAEMVGDVRQPRFEDALIALNCGKVGQLVQPMLHSSSSVCRR